jgi:adenylate kinase
MKTHMIFVGPPGAGKGSHAKIVSERLGIPHISTGDIFRKELKNEKLIALVKSYTDHGQLVPDEITNEIVRERFQRDDVKKGFILDGYPRNPSQAAYFDKLLAELGMKLDVVFNITSETDMILFRITGRRTCPTCGRIYHIINHPPKVDGICDNDGTPLVQRADDTKETILKRLAVYNEQTYPLIDYYKKTGVLVNVDGNREIEPVTTDMFKLLGE